jgi:steroid delta-isomerase-like uncharacterized protein
MKRTIAMTIMCVAMMWTGAPVWADDAQSRCTRIGNKWVKFWNGLNAQRASEVFTEDIVYEDVTLGAVFHGIDEFKGFAENAFVTFPHATFTLVNSSCSGQQGVIEWGWNGPDSPIGFCGTGKPFTVRGVTIIEIKGNRISRNSDFWDLATVLRQLLPEGQECVARLLGVSEE